MIKNTIKKIGLGIEHLPPEQRKSLYFKVYMIMAVATFCIALLFVLETVHILNNIREMEKMNPGLFLQIISPNQYVGLTFTFFCGLYAAFIMGAFHSNINQDYQVLRKTSAGNEVEEGQSPQ